MDILHHARGETEQPSAANEDIPQPDPDWLARPHIPDGMDHGQVAVQAGQEVEERLASSNAGQYRYDGTPLLYLPCHWSVVVGASSHQAQQLQNDHVVGEDVHVASGGGWPPSL